ncbi:hypothetical protein [Thauera humireducens]
MADDGQVRGKTDDFVAGASGNAASEGKEEEEKAEVKCSSSR